MKKFIHLVFYLFFVQITAAQIANYNQFPTLKPSHILDENLTDISFALSMRVVVSDYEGPLVRLRRASDNAQQDFGWAENDIVDVTAIDAWRSGSIVYMVTWYDQSGLGRNATQSTAANQPRFYPVASKPYFQGDGSNDHLTVNTPNGIQDVTNAGNQGSVLAVLNATTKSQYTFGVLTGSDRWQTHTNWSDNNLYFDPGICCNSPRAFNNNANVGVWKQYTFVKSSTHVFVRSNGFLRFNGTHTTGRCTRTEDFAIGWATGNQPGGHSTTSFTEMIMYKMDISTTLIGDIEQDTITFWSL